MRHIVTFARLGRHGRLANAMYQIAGTIGIARKSGFDSAFPYWANYNGADFEPDIDTDVQKEFLNPLPLYNGADLPELGIPWGYHDVRLTKSVSLLGHFQSEKYFSHCLDEIKWYFTMKDEPPLQDVVAIHARFGDYGKQPSPQHPDGNPYHPRMNMSYYGPAMALFPGARFLVFSDGIEECKQMFGDSVEYSEGRNYFEDFKLMKRCRHFIIANSSYSAMAAILGNEPDKRVIAPYPWFGGPYTDQLDPKDIYSPGWTVINYQTGSAEIKQAA